MQQIRFCGLGGQGVQMSGALLARGAFLEGRYVALSAGYGTQVRGGITRSDLIISERFVEFPLLTEVDLLVATLDEALQESLPMVKPAGLIFVDRSMVLLRECGGEEIRSIPAAESAIAELHNEVLANVVLLGAVNAVSRIVSPDSLELAVRETVPSRYLEGNLMALEVGRRLAQEL
jgi:2-oxoglutarate ferredoxin oxidoreductase subunit gamma